MKTVLLNRGKELLALFCENNVLPIPPVNVRASAEWPYGLCAYYRPTKIEICVAKCASIGTAGPAWSYPGYAVDRTPYGVLQHELGHHADVVMGRATKGYVSEYSFSVRKESGEAPLTSYCPNAGEWFAEMFRLFVTNPDLLQALRPATFKIIARDFTPVVTASWQEVLKDAPERTKAACQRRVSTERRA